MIHAIHSFFVFYRLLFTSLWAVHPVSHLQPNPKIDPPVVVAHSKVKSLVKLEGIIHLQKSDTIREIMVMLPTYASMDPIEIKVPLDHEGRFSVAIPIHEGFQEVYVMVGRSFFKSIWIQNGLSIQVDMADPSSSIFSGADAAINEAYQAYEAQMEVLHISIPDSLKEKSNQIIVFMENEFRQRRAKDSLFFAHHPSALMPIVLEQRQSNFYGQLLSQFWPKNELLPQDLEKIIYAYKPEHTTLSNTSFYYQLHTYIKRSHIFPRYVKEGKPALSEADWETIYTFKETNASSVQNEEQRISYYSDEIMLFLFLKMKAYTASHFSDRAYERVLMPVNVANEDQFRLLYSYVFSDIQTPFYRTVIDRRLQAAMPQLAHLEERFSALKALDKPVSFGRLRYETNFGAKLYVVDSLNEKTILTLLQEEFGNTPFLLDFWAVWCVPCIQSMPHSKQLQQDIPELPFLYICTSNSSSEKSWVKKVLELEQPGIHLFVPEEMVQRWMKKWNLAGFPSVALYKPEHNQVIELKNFTHLSTEQLKKSL